MSVTGFLLDEHVSLRLVTQLRQLAPEVRVYAIGIDDAPPKGTADPDLLRWIEVHDCILITNNRASMPVHLANHFLEGRHVPGVLQLPERLNFGRMLEDILLIWSASTPEDYRDRIAYLPL